MCVSLPFKLEPYRFQKIFQFCLCRLLIAVTNKNQNSWLEGSSELFRDENWQARCGSVVYSRNIMLDLNEEPAILQTDIQAFTHSNSSGSSAHTSPTTAAASTVNETEVRNSSLASATTSSSTSGLSSHSAGINEIKKRYRYQMEDNILNKFMVENLVVGILGKYSSLLDTGIALGNVASNLDSTPRLVTGDKLVLFIKQLLKRSRATRLQFKHVCVMLIKFLACCSRGTNYMKFLKYDIRKLVVGTLVLTRERTGHNEEVLRFFQRITGLHWEEISNICTIVKNVLGVETRRQRRYTIRPPVPQWPHTPNGGNEELNNNSTLSPREDFNTRRSTFGANTGRRLSHGYDDDTSDEGKYVLDQELEDFNEMGKRLVHTHFMVI